MNDSVAEGTSLVSADLIETGQPTLREESIRASATTRPAAITAEIVAVIEVAVTAFAGRELRIISVRVGSEAQAVSSSWTDQGRDMIHASHNLVQRGH
jgi:hypothetical protein